MRFIHVDSKKYIARLVVVFGLVITPAIFAQGYTIEPAPSWVKAAQIPDSYTLNQQNNSDGEAYVLVDLQWQVREGQQNQYRHIATKALNTTGVSEASQISIDFDPVYETLVLHTINIQRNAALLTGLTAHGSISYSVKKISITRSTTDPERRVFSSMIFVPATSLNTVTPSREQIRYFPGTFQKT